METPPTRFRGLFSIGDGIALVGVVITLAVSCSQYQSNKTAAELQHRQASTKIAAGFLSARAPKDSEGKIQEFEPDQQRLRRWAIQLLNDNADIKIPEDAVDVIATGRAAIRPYGTDWGYTDYGTTWDYAEPKGPRSEPSKELSPSPPPDAPRGKR